MLHKAAEWVFFSKRCYSLLPLLEINIFSINCYIRVDKQEKKKLFLCKVVHVREWVYSKYSVCVCVLLVPKDVQIGNWFN